SRPRRAGRRRPRRRERTRPRPRKLARMEPLYKPEGVEERWQRTWEEEGLYGAEPGSGRETFVVAHPPPNVTGALHTGHALQISLADALEICSAWPVCSAPVTFGGGCATTNVSR